MSAWIHKGQCDNVGTSLDFRGSHRTAEGGCSSEFVSWPNRDFHPLHGFPGLLTLVEPKAILHVDTQEMAGLAIREQVTSWRRGRGSGGVSVGAPLVRDPLVPGEPRPYLGLPWSAWAFGKEALYLEKKHSLVTGSGPEEEHLSLFSHLYVGYFDSLFRVLGDIWSFCEIREAFQGVKWCLTVDCSGNMWEFNTFRKTPDTQELYKGQGDCLFLLRL